MCWIVGWVVPVILLQAGVSLQVNAEDNAEDKAISEKLIQNLQNGNSKPHIVVILADDLGWNDVSWHNPKIQTPNLEQLAVTGVILNQSYVQPVCTPSRAALLTGKYPFTLGRQHRVIDTTSPDGLTTDATLLPQELKKLGYSTHIVGKWHLGFCNIKYTPTKRGFDTFYGIYSGHSDYFYHTEEAVFSDCECIKSKACKDANGICKNECDENDQLIANACHGQNCTGICCAPKSELICKESDKCILKGGECKNKCGKNENTLINGCSGEKCKKKCCISKCKVLEKCSNNGGVCKAACDNGEKNVKNGCTGKSCTGVCCAPVLTQEGIANCEKGYDFHNNTTPDFTVAGTYSTYVFASYIEDLLKTRNAIEPMFLYMPFQSIHRPLQVPAEYMEPYNYVEDLNRRTTMGMVSAMDEAVGRIVTALKETSHYNNSVIVFLTDNGGDTLGGNNWPLRGSKHTLWEGGTRGTTFVHSPLLNNTGTVSNQLVHVTDWFATLLGVAGGNIPEGLDSIDQWEAIAGNVDPPRDKLIYNLDDYHHPKAGIRIGDYKLLVGEGGFDEWLTPPEGLPNENINKLMTHLNIAEGEQKPFIVEEIPDLGINYKGNVNRSETPREWELPKTFAEMLNWTAEDLVKYNMLKLFNLKDDPTEHHDIAESNPSLVEELLDHLLQELSRAVPPSVIPSEPRGHPYYWNNIWTTGWC